MSQFKAMKFWIGDDKDLFTRVAKILRESGYIVHNNLLLGHQKGAISVDEKKVSWMCRENDIDWYKEYPAREINIDWMRTPKEETVELNGKKYMKSELEEALKHIRPVEE